MSLSLAVLGLLLLSPLGSGTQARAQTNCTNCDLPPGCRGDGSENGIGNQTRNCQQLNITIESDIDFGRVVLLGDGEAQVILDLSTGQKIVIGDGDDLGGMPITGKAMITGAPFEQVVIGLPGEVAMRDPSGGKARLRDIVTDLDGFPRLDANGQLEFHFSATLLIDAETSASGNLRGRIPISVEYP
ncbi:MAG: DUF4402 domain-containing protein [Pseudomonadota bacterium]